MKTSAHFSRYQVKPRRRRQCKTDYGARRALVKVPKNKYDTVKYRFVVRQTNSQVICQFVRCTLAGDKIAASATSNELSKYGIKFGLKNASAHYATGLLAGRRLLTNLGLDKEFTANPDFGQDLGDSMSERKGVEACLDIGIITMTRGRKVMTALKGATDAGVMIPHSPHNFPGYSADKECVEPDMHRDRIYGKHVAEYMTLMKDENPNKFEQHFADFTKHGVTPDNLESTYKKAFESIVADCGRTISQKKVTEHSHKDGKMQHGDGKTYKFQVRLTREERRSRVAAKIAQIAALTAKQ